MHRIAGNLSSDKVKQQILYELYFEKRMSCSDLSFRIKKSLPVIAKSLNELIEDTFVVEEGYAASSGGRRPIMYSLRARAQLIIAVSMDQLSTRIAIYDLTHNLVADIKTFDLELRNNAEALSSLVRYINAYIKDSKCDKESIIGVGIGMPGFIDVKKGNNYSFLDAGDESLQNRLSTEIGLPVYIDNDSCLIALAELKFGKAKHKQDVMVVNIAWGIGLGMILNGQLFRGHSGFAGEFSHIPTSESGRLCSCGKRGCLETDASLLVLAERAIADIRNGRISSLQHSLKEPSEQAGDAIMKAANKGDQYAIELISDAGYAIGKGLAVLIHIINPEVIVLSGRGAVVGKILTPTIQQAIHKYAIPRLAESTELRISELGINAELVGAAALVMEYVGKGLHRENVRRSETAVEPENATI
jgi:predicted NBD/HSP70 family sugar kinase